MLFIFTDNLHLIIILITNLSRPSINIAQFNFDILINFFNQFVTPIIEDIRCLRQHFF